MVLRNELNLRELEQHIVELGGIINQKVEAFGTRHEVAWLDCSQAGQAILARWHADRVHPKCCCVDRGVEMYVVRRGCKLHVSRMPGSGMAHSSGCPSYEAVNVYSGAECYLPGVVMEDITKLIITKFSPQQQRGNQSFGIDHVSQGGMIDTLIERAELNYWYGVKSRKAARKWPLVREILLECSSSIRVNQDIVSDRLLIPRGFEQASYSKWRIEDEERLRSRDDMLLVGLCKEVRAAKNGFILGFKHMPETKFWIGKTLGSSLLKDLGTWRDTTTQRLIYPILGLFLVRPSNKNNWFVIEQYAVRRVTEQFMPCTSDKESWLASKLIADDRVFMRPLEYENVSQCGLASFALLDTDITPYPIFVFDDVVRDMSLARDRARVLVRNHLPVSIWDAPGGHSLHIPMPKRNIDHSAHQMEVTTGA